MPVFHPSYNLLSQSFTDYAQDHADLGAALNGFSLNESEGLSDAIEKTGQAVDATYMSTTKLVRTISLAPNDLPEEMVFVAARPRTKLGRTAARIFAICFDNQEIARVSTSKTRAVRDDTGRLGKQARATRRPREE